MPVEHWMGFGTFAQQRYFEYPKPKTYAGVVINANMAAHAPAGMAAFLQEKTAEMRYIVDPLTHAFQHNPSAISTPDGEPKKAIKALAEHYGSPVEDLVGVRRLAPSAFDKPKILEGFVGRCLAFQQTHLAEHMKASEAAKYLGDGAARPPYALVAPYFFLTETNLDEWLPVCVRSAQIACKIGTDFKTRVFGAVIVNQGIILDPHSRAEVIREFSKVPVAGFLLWIDDLDEEVANEHELRGLLELARGLRAGGREVVNLHGGYFSVLAGGAVGKNALTGVAHGPEFGEYRAVVPVGGGIPIARYYLWQLHSRTRYRDVVAVLNDLGWLKSAKVFHKQVCDCEECTAVLDGDPGNFTLFGESTVRSVRRGAGIVRIDFSTAEAKGRCLRHYLQRKRQEYVFASEAPRDVALSQLLEDAKPFREVLGSDGVAHLTRWHKVLS